MIRKGPEQKSLVLLQFSYDSIGIIKRRVFMTESKNVSDAL